MRKMKIVNNVTGRSYANKGTRKELMAWFNENAPTGCFGKPDRWLGVEEPGHVAKREIDTEFGKKTQWFYKEEYSFEIIDITDEHEEQEELHKRTAAIHKGQRLIAKISHVLAKKSVKKQIEKMDKFKDVMTSLSFGFLDVAKAQLEEMEESDTSDKKIKSKLLEKLK